MSKSHKSNEKVIEGLEEVKDSGGSSRPKRMTNYPRKWSDYISHK